MFSLANNRKVERAGLGLSILVSAASPIMFVTAALGSKWGWWNWRFGLGVMTRDWGPPLAWAGIGLAVCVALVCLVRRPRWGAIVALGFALLPAAMLYGLRAQQAKVLALLAIYDVQTDWSKPIAYSSEALKERNAAVNANPIHDDAIVIDDGRRGRWAGMRFADAQAIGYPDLKPLLLDMTSDQVPDVFASTLQAQGLTLRRTYSGEDGRIYMEGYAQTAWYRLVDDFAIRTAPTADQKTRIDMRSSSREGHIDLGENAKRIRKVLNAAARPARP